MEIVKTNGIVLSSARSGESDILCRILTPERGKHSYMFKGLRKSRTRPKTAAEPGTEISFVYYHHAEKNIHVINEFSVEKSYSEFRDDLSRYYILCLILELADRTIPIANESGNKYKLISGAIRELSVTSEKMKLALFFFVRMMKELGILPDFEHLKGFPGKSAIRKVFLDDDCLKLYQLCAEKKFSVIEKIVIDDSKVSLLLYFSALYIEDYYHVVIKSKEFVFKG